MGGSFCVRINDCNSSFFKAGKGLKQGDPSSPVLFNFVADVFTKMLCKAASNGMIRGFLPQIIHGGVISLQYVDDTILFLENNINFARNLKWFLACFEYMSGLRINYHKTDLMTVHVNPEDARATAQVLDRKSVV